MEALKLSGPAEDAVSKLQDTNLSPMEEALFQAWAKANQIKKPDAPDDIMDYRGVYKTTSGAILPPGDLKKISSKTNNEAKLQRILQERLSDRVTYITQEHLQKIKAFDAATQPRESTS